MFTKILIANRGEIACRVAATARRLGIATVAVYSDADANAKHVAACDEAYWIGPAAAAESYLRADRILAIAQRCGAEAIHPGYGFLSENEGFATAIAAAGLVFIGPPASAIAAMGSKSAAKELMGRAGVPLVPGYHGAEQDADYLKEQADAIGYPVLIKASAGGGGKGMRMVSAEGDFAAALQSCRREARNSFGDDRVLIERYVLEPRHIEIQVFADRHGGCVYLFERDCSVQRRHQKVIEEAPAPGMTAQRRQAMGEAAVAAARAVGYVGAGTVEFIADQAGNFHFMEMNTRLQVEHPVTEMITGYDLVEWQLRVASGEELPVTQERLAIHGHAIEARIYAETPLKNFLPSIGHLAHLRTPQASSFAGQGSPAWPGGSRAVLPDAVRIDSGVRENDDITPFYDPMIAKLIVWGADRQQAIARMKQALARYEVGGPGTNIEFLARLMRNESFGAGRLDTGLIERERADLLPEPVAPPLRTLAIAAAAVLANEDNAARRAPIPASGSAADPALYQQSDWSDPFSAPSGWRSASVLARLLPFTDSAGHYAVEVDYHRDGYLVRLDGATICLADVALDPLTRRLRCRCGDEVLEVGCVIDGETIDLFLPDGPQAIGYAPPLAHAGDEAADPGRLTAPMPGKVIALLVAAGDRVTAGQPLVIMEAMKMEHTIAAPHDGEIRQILYAVGDQVIEGARLIEMGAA